LDPLDVTKDSQGEFDYVFNNRHRLKLIKRFVLATDDDPVGKRLRAELVRRLLPSRCSFVGCAGGCKGLNAVVMTRGAAEVACVPFRRNKLRCIRQSSPLVRAKWGDAIGDLDQAALRETDQWINDHFLFIASDPLGQADDDTIYLDWLLDRAVDCVYRYGIRVF